MMRDVEEEEYEQRLKKTKLMSLEMRRRRSDLIEVCKIMHNLEGLERVDFFPLCSAGRRCHQYTTTKHSRLNSRKYFFSQRVVDQWNRLPTTTVCAETITYLPTGLGWEARIIRCKNLALYIRDCESLCLIQTLKAVGSCNV